ncbi:MAG TPA: superoxide dismutase family protein [Terriglobales bacterium]|nr:superoxide dismutase family protein [Terriglobales bacterium]
MRQDRWLAGVGALGALVLGAMVISNPALADQVVVKLNAISASGVGDPVGTVTISDSADGMKLAFNLRNMPQGDHGAHIHENPNCGPGEKDGQMMAGLAAGDHYDPEHTGHHMGPNGMGHLGDLEVVSIDPSGMDTEITTAKRLHVSDIRGRALVIHSNADNFTDTPPNGGGGARIACGVIPK